MGGVATRATMSPAREGRQTSGTRSYKLVIVRRTMCDRLQGADQPSSHESCILPQRTQLEVQGRPPRIRSSAAPVDGGRTADPVRQTARRYAPKPRAHPHFTPALRKIDEIAPNAPDICASYRPETVPGAREPGAVSARRRASSSCWGVRQPRRPRPWTRIRARRACSSPYATSRVPARGQSAESTRRRRWIRTSLAPCAQHDASRPERRTHESRSRSSTSTPRLESVLTQRQS